MTMNQLRIDQCRIIWLGCLCLLAVFGALNVHGAAAQVPPDPHLEWRTLKTKHAQVHYHQPLGPLAQRIADAIERAHAELSVLFNTTSDQITHIVLSDQSDDANGFAKVLPYKTIQLYATAPDDLSPLADYDDWLLTLVTHEYSHIMHIDTIGGIPAIVNAIFGKVMAPNSIEPRWFLEGLAVHNESEYTTAGRIRSSIFEMYMRADVLDDQLLRLDQISHIADRWPHGTQWYLYGSRFAHYIAETYGKDALARFAKIYGSQPIPYGLSRTAKRVTGLTFPELYTNFTRSLRDRVQREADLTRAQGVVEGKRITFHGESTRSPRFLDNRRIAYVATTNRMRSQVRVMPLDDIDRFEEVTRVQGTATLGVHRASKRIVASSLNSFRNLYYRYDLHLYDDEGKHRTRLSQGLRAHEPDIDPSGRYVAFRLNRAGTSHLAFVDLAEKQKKTRVIWKSPEMGQVYTPRFSPDGKRIAFSVWQRGGFRDIVVLDFVTRKATRITHDRAFDSGPAWTPDGKSLLFSSDRGGVNNIYSYDFASTSLKQITNVLTGAFSPDVSPDGKQLVYLGYTSKGYDVFVMSLKAETFREPGPYVVQREDARPTQKANLESSSYNPLNTLGPRAYYLAYNDNGIEKQLTVSTHGTDAVGLHRYNIQTNLGLERGYPSFAATYSLNRYVVIPSLRVFRDVAPQQNLVVGGEQRTWIENSYGASLGLSYTFLRAFSRDTVSLNYTWSMIDKLQPFGGKIDPNTSLPRLPFLGRLSNLSLGWLYSDTERYIYDISSSRGTRVGITTTTSHPMLASDRRSQAFEWNIARYIPLSYRYAHVLALHYRGGAGWSDTPTRPLFALGGMSQPSLVDALVNYTSVSGTGLRGYRPFDRGGNQYHLLQIDYRFLLWRMQRGIATLPFFINRLYAAPFVDVGDAFFGKLDFNRIRAGTGVELFIDYTVAYVDELTMRLGFARGINEGGQTQFYVNLGTPF